MEFVKGLIGFLVTQFRDGLRHTGEGRIYAECAFNTHDATA